jgi:type VI secretion system protein VasJ
MSELLLLITAPIPGDNPMGQNINYDSDFDVIKAEIGKLGEIDCDAIEKAALTILKEKSKDIRVMAFFSFVLLRNERWEELADVFDGFAKLAAQNFDIMFPDRERAKEQGIKWLNETRFADMVASRAPSGKDYPNVVRLRDSLAGIKPVLEQKFPQTMAFPAVLFSAVQKWEVSTKPKPQQQQTTASSAGGPATSGQTAETVETPAQAQANGRKTALFLIEKEPVKPMGYRLLRALRWDILEKVPPAESGKTQVQGPSNEQRAFFQGVTSKNDWQNALLGCQKAFASGGNHLWIDLQRISVISCKNLGNTFDTVKGAILYETALFIKRLPGVQNLNFNDNTPFCDAATKDWIEKEVQPFLSMSGGISGQTPNKSEKDGFSIESESAKVKDLVGLGKIEQALDFLHSQIQESRSERDNFRRSILLGHLLVTNKRPDIALAILESLDDKISKYNLEKWDPALAVEAWLLLYEAYKVAKVAKPQNTQIVISEKQNTILQKISRADPKSAFRISA